MTTPQPPDFGGWKPSDAGGTTNQSESPTGDAVAGEVEEKEQPKPRRRRLGLRRPRLPRPRLRRRKLTKPPRSGPRLRRPKLQAPRPPKGVSDLWFRFVTRLRAIGYWLGEKAEATHGRLTRGAERIGGWWSRRSRRARIRIYAVAGVVLVYAIVKFIPIPGVPCQVSAAKECAPSNDTIAFVPENAAMYAHVTVNSDSHQGELAEELRDRLPSFVGLLQESTSALPSPSGKTIDVASAVLPFAEDDVALVVVPGPNGTASSAYIVGVEDQAKADQFIASIAPPGQPTATTQPPTQAAPPAQPARAKKRKGGKKGKASKKATGANNPPAAEGAAPPEQQGSALNVYPGGFSSAKSGDELLFGAETAVRAALDAEAGRVPKLEESDLDAARDALPDVRVAEVYLSPAGVRQYLVGRTGAATQLDTFVDYGATTGMAASARLKDNGIEIDLVSELDPELEQQSPTVFADLPEFRPALADEVGATAIGYIGVGELGPALNRILSTAGGGAQGVAGSLRALAARVQQEAGVDPLSDLLPALAGQAALVAEPTDAVPFATLIVEGIDETKATEALTALQGPILRSLGTGGPQVPAFQTTEEDGVTVYSVQASATVTLSYAIFDRKLVVSTQPAGVSQAIATGDGLADTEGYEDVTDELPDPVSALVFLNLEELLGLPPLQESLAVNALYASLSEDLSRIGSLAVAVRGSEEELRSELFMAIDE